MKPQVIAVAGPTASGKSDLALQLAQKLDGEIICMDSMQIYRRMDIGTAKPTAEEQALVAHHMLDIVDPTENYAVADYAQNAEKVICEIAARGKQPILVGGTGLYLKALMHGLSLGNAGGDEKIRARLYAMAEEPEGKAHLHRQLAEVDPASATKFHPNDIRRVIRALEVYELTGTPISRQRQDEPERPFSILPLAIDMPREVLYARLEKRVHLMMQQGLLEEVEALLKSGVTAGMQSMQGIGYKELIPVVQGLQHIDDAVWQIVLNTRHYAKRQGTWLRTEPKTIWITEAPENRFETAMKHIKGFRKGIQE
ncbi:MAG: tRNA (adenosine(37)-N6)-dimethylallyltransferase MiaA [Clostridia bacterium]|nr:tRNA (adenosine(37)-N6)-dimethylallyltransferase MiaA [Clostridia bacterium]